MGHALGTQRLHITHASCYCWLNRHGNNLGSLSQLPSLRPHVVMTGQEFPQNCFEGLHKLGSRWSQPVQGLHHCRQDCNLSGRMAPKGSSKVSLIQAAAQHRHLIA